MVASVEFGTDLCEELSPLGAVSLRRMFSKTGVFCDGVMFAMVSDNELYLRVDSQNRDAFAEAASTPPLNYTKRGRTIDLFFWRAPDRVFDDLANSSHGPGRTICGSALLRADPCVGEAAQGAPSGDWLIPRESHSICTLRPRISPAIKRWVHGKEGS